MAQSKTISAATGASAFLASHMLEVAEWPAFDAAGAYKPWFLNSGRAVLFTAVWLFAAAAVEGAVAAVDRRDALVRGATLAGGAVAAMAVVMLWAGPGTIFPIALAFGAAIAGASGVAGMLAGRGARRAARRGAS